MTPNRWSRENLSLQFSELESQILASPYNAYAWLKRASFLQSCDYHDLAVGDFYKALLLTDEILDTSGEYHEQAIASYRSYNPDADEEVDGLSQVEIENLKHIVSDCYAGIGQCLLALGCFHDAHDYCQRGLAAETSNSILKALERDISSASHLDRDEDADTTTTAERSKARREIYPWNTFEPNRYTEASLELLNDQINRIAPNCVVRVVELPVLHSEADKNKSELNDEVVPTVKQLGVFAKTDIQPGDMVLEEGSMLAVNNRLHDELCDACSAELPADPNDSFACGDCQTAVYCSESCQTEAWDSYHVTACGKESFEAINKDVEMSEATDALYGLLLGRALCMSQAHSEHPLNLTEVKFLWGDYSPWTAPLKLKDGTISMSAERPRTLPWSFRYNVTDPIHMLEALDVDIFADADKYDFWVINTLLAKFRGVANARMNPRTGKPEVAAVHPLWCLANHSCAPNVTWEWGGKIKMWARDGSKGEVVRWGPGASDSNEATWRGGVKAGEEILNHYCDVSLPVKERREWAAGALGGDCMCERCKWESSLNE